MLNYTSESSAQASSDLSASLTEKYGVVCLVVQADMGTAAGPLLLGGYFRLLVVCFEQQIFPRLVVTLHGSSREHSL